MPKCKNCNNLYNLSDKNDVIVGKWCPKINDSPHLDADRDCEHYKAMTNADRIRSMTDEELAGYLPMVADFICQPTEECTRNTICNRGECDRTEDCAMKWLKAEREELLEGAGMNIENINDRIDVVEARKIIEAVTTLAKSCAFTHIEAMKIAKTCQDCCDRLESEVQG